MIIGYTAGVYDLFHIGHLNLLKNAKGMCDKLIVSVTTDELVSYKHKRAIVPFGDWMDIVHIIRYIDAVVPREIYGFTNTLGGAGDDSGFTIGFDWCYRDKEYTHL